MIDVIIVLAVLAIVAGAGLYIYKEKKAGAACVGCPHAKSCGSSKCSCQSGH